MWATFLLTLIIVGIAVIFLALNIIVKKNGKFPEIHIGKNKAMKERGIKCTATQDREAVAEQSGALSLSKCRSTKNQ